jgi:uncharacterized cupin superfamily protein
MKKVNIAQVTEEPWDSPKGKYAMRDRNISVALGLDEQSPEARNRHPFDVELCRIPAGKAGCPFHSHTRQWEYYQVVSGTGRVRDTEGWTDVGPGDAFIFGPGEAHQVSCGGPEDLVLLIVADNPQGEACHYPDSGKWLIRGPQRAMLKGDGAGYFDGEE